MVHIYDHTGTVVPLFSFGTDMSLYPAKGLKWQAENVFLFFTVYIVTQYYYSSEYFVIMLYKIMEKNRKVIN
jgi:hypothetical protein